MFIVKGLPKPANSSLHNFIFIILNPSINKFLSFRNNLKVILTFWSLSISFPLLIYSFEVLKALLSIIDKYVLAGIYFTYISWLYYFLLIQNMIVVSNTACWRDTVRWKKVWLLWKRYYSVWSLQGSRHQCSFR